MESLPWNLGSALGPDHPHVAVAKSNLAKVLLELHREAEALPLAESAYARRQRDDTPATFRADTQFVLARALWSVDRPHRDRTRARELAELALRSFRSDQDLHANVIHSIERWLDDPRAPLER